MSQETADIVGTTGAAFTATITYGEIGEAYLEVTGTKTPLTVSGNKQAVTVPNLPSGESRTPAATVVCVYVPPGWRSLAMISTQLFGLLTISA